MSILGIDYGAKKIGLAKSDQNQKIAMPLRTVFNHNQPALLIELQSVCQAENIEKIVVGVPVSLSASQGNLLRDKDLQNQQVKEVLSFIIWLRGNINLPVEMEDERLSTKMANRLQRDLVKKNGDDPVAAMLILQSYLDKINFK